jgi:hypothetical protein
MVTTQEWLEQKYPNKSEVKEIKLINSENVNGGSLTIQDYPNLEKIEISNFITLKFGFKPILKSPLDNLTIRNCPALISIDLSANNLTNIDFLNTLPHPEKLEELVIADNNIKPTTLDFLTPFINLKTVLLGTDQQYWEKENNCNLFYGSLEPLKNLTKLEKLCISGTDINSGLEYLPNSLIRANENINNSRESTITSNTLDCLPIRPNAKVKIIQDQLRPLDYDLGAWKIINSLNLRENELEKKINETKQGIIEVENWGRFKFNKKTKLARLQDKLKILEETKQKFEQKREEKKQLKEENTNLLDQLSNLKQVPRKSNQ